MKLPAAVLALVIGLGALVWAQSATAGAIQGVLPDSKTGEKLPGVTVVATSPSLQGAQTAITDDNGVYKITDLPQDGGLSVTHGEWSHDDRFIGYTVKKTLENLSHHLYIADVSSTPERIEVTSVHTNNVQWRPGTNTRHVAYTEYPRVEAQQRVMLGTVETNPLRVTTRPLIEHAPSDLYGITYEWNADGTAILHHGGATGEYAVTFIEADGTPTKVPLGLFFRDEDSTRWTIPYLGWSKDGRRLICRTNTGNSIASIDVATKQVTAPIELPTDIDFAWWDRRLATP